jgi:iron-sulfur cluster repair protein YtfE (RIC family)
MSTGFEHLHREHEELRNATERLRMTAEHAGRATVDELLALVVADRRFLMEQLLPHACGEEDVLYPAVQHVLESDKATLGMEHDHRHIELLTLEVGQVEAQLRTIPVGLRDLPLDPEVATDLRRIFYSLYALIINHFEKEERIYAPYLAHAMSPGDAQLLTDRLEAAIAAHKVPAVPMVP